MNIELDKLKKRAKRKYLLNPVMGHFLSLKSPLRSAYYDTLSCSSSIQCQDGKIRSRYCRRMWCGICSPIKTACRIKSYEKGLHDLGDLQLTTLTMANCEHHEVRANLRKFRLVFKGFRDMYRKRGLTFRGVYNFECTNNPYTRLYHPHIHIIHECIPQFDKEFSERSPAKGKQFKNELCEYWKQHSINVDMRGQDTRICYDLKEGFKYASKSIFKLRIGEKNELIIPVVELDLLYRQLTGVHCFQSFGIKKIKEEDIDKMMDELTAYTVDKPDGSYVWALHDWVLRHDKKIKLSNFTPTKNNADYHAKLTKNKHYKPPG